MASTEPENSPTGDAVTILRWWTMLLRAKGTPFRKLLHLIVTIALRLFFRRIETAGVERVPHDSPVIFAANHPNGLVDPALVFVSLPRRVSFLAKSTLFEIPVLGRLIRAFEALPVYRTIDSKGDAGGNIETFRACRKFLSENRCVAIFPEGISHDETMLKPVKTGAARIALGAVGVRDHMRPIDLKIMAVGLFYTSKTSFRSEVLIRFGELIDVAPVELDENGEPPREAVRTLTKQVETALTKVTLNVGTESERETVVRAEALFSSVYQNLLFKRSLTQSFLQLQKLAEKYELLGRNDPEKMRALNSRIMDYETELRSSGLTPESLSLQQHPTWYVFRFLVLRLTVLLFLSPLALIGTIVHSPAYVLSNFAGQLFKTHGPDAAGSTYKILAAIVLMPLTWLIVGGLAFYVFGWRIAALSIPLTMLCGYVALRISETLVDLTVWIRAAWMLFRQRALFLRLLVAREALNREIGEMIEDNE